MRVTHHLQRGRAIKVRKSLRQLCRQTFLSNRPQPERYDTTLPIDYEMRVRNDGHMFSRRLVVYLRGTMCEWNSLSGGCVYCGFYRVTNGGTRISDSDQLAQIEAARSSYCEQNANAVGLYNDGSFFNDREIGRELQMEILRRVSRWPGIQQITVESRIEYLTEQKLTAARSAAGSCVLEVATGIDSTSQEIVDLTSNRGIHVRSALDRLAMASELGLRTTALMVFGLPFLSDAEAVNDAQATIEELLSRGICVDIEAMTVQKGSLLHRLYEARRYRVPWLWSLVELLRRLPDVTNVYLSPFSYSVLPMAVPSNCPRCTSGVVRQIFDVFLQSRDKADLPTLQECCGARWRQDFESSPATTALDRAEDALAYLASGQGSRRAQKGWLSEATLQCVESQA